MLQCQLRLWVSLTLCETELSHGSQGEILTCRQHKFYLTTLSCLPFWEESDKVIIILLFLPICPYKLRNISKEAQNGDWTPVVCTKYHE